ncbi:hypothetical protein DRJ54_05925 [Candidatus Acetothermia bacterium]|nr:MAG: hypothetical protein DRJ54_05925 [Candidatus Acetothermia bacterium]
MTVSAAPQPDLVIQDISYSPSSPSVGSTVTFQVTVRNQGTAAAGAFAVSFAGQARSVSSLAAGASRTLTFSAVLSGSPQTFTAVADPYSQVTESDETNNTRQVTVTGQEALSAEAGGPYSGTAGQPITFDGRASQGPIVSYTWDFGDGSTGSGAVVTHVYATPGTYTVTLTVRAGDGRTASDTAQVTVSAAPQPDLVIQNITYSPSSPTVGSTVTFQATVRNQGGAPAGAFYLRLEGASGHRNSYISGLGAGASHTVTLSLPLSTSPETFTATADYYGQVAESDEANNTRQVTITAAAPPLTLSLSLDRASYNVGDPVRITVVLSRAAYVYLVEVDSSGVARLVFPNWWERSPQLPAGTTVLPRGSYTIEASLPAGAETLHGFAADAPIPHFPTSFPSPGFPVLSGNGAAFVSQVQGWLSGNMPAGSWDHATANFTVVQAANQPPVARFSYSPASPMVGQWIQFDASASSDSDGSITSYQWDFGDGTSATGVRVNKRYGAAGTYTVTLTVRDDRGATDTETKTVSVGTANQPPVARFSYSPTNPDPGDVVGFDGSASSDSDGSIISWEWDFGDGTSGTGVTVNHAFPAEGSYTVTLTVRDDDGATDSVSKTIQVGTPATPPLPGMPTIDRPGIYVWGEGRSVYWHITVVGDPSWSSPRPFRVEVSGRAGSLRDVSVNPDGAPAPQVAGNKRSLTWEGTVGSGWVDLQFRTTQDYLMLSLSLDLDGDGTAELVPPERIYLRQYKVNPPANPVIIGKEGGGTTFDPTINFKLGSGTLSRIVWITTIEQLEAGAR